MRYSELKDFIENKMRMSHIYQPVMIKALIDAKGALPTDKIASKFLEYDTSQIEYYEQITKKLSGKRWCRILTSKRLHRPLLSQAEEYSLQLMGRLRDCRSNAQSLHLKALHSQLVVRFP